MDGEQNKEKNGKNKLSIKSLIESLLFVASEPALVDRLASILELSAEQVEGALQELDKEYARRGLRLQRKRGRVQMVTAPEAADQVRTFLGLELGGKLSPAALETLAIVAYRQPVTRAQVEAVRGVNSDSVIRTLVNRGLIEEQGRLEQAGRPIIYGTTFEFLQQFGISGTEELPPLESLEETHRGYNGTNTAALPDETAPPVAPGGSSGNGIVVASTTFSGPAGLS